MPTATEIRAIRRYVARMTQREFAAAAGVAQRTVESWEYGRRSCPAVTWQGILRGLRARCRPTPNAVRRARRLARRSQPRAAQSIGVSLICWQQWEEGTRRMPALSWALFLDAHSLPTDLDEHTDMLRMPDGFLGGSV